MLFRSVNVTLTSVMDPAGQVMVNRVLAPPPLEFQKATCVLRGGVSEITSATVMPDGIATDFDSSLVMFPSSGHSTSACCPEPAVCGEGQIVTRCSLSDEATLVTVELAIVQTEPHATNNVAKVAFTFDAADVAVKRNTV